MMKRENLLFPDFYSLSNYDLITELKELSLQGFRFITVHFKPNIRSLPIEIGLRWLCPFTKLITTAEKHYLTTCFGRYNHLKPDKTLNESYKPISLLPVILKLFEKFLLQRLKLTI